MVGDLVVLRLEKKISTVTSSTLLGRVIYALNIVLSMAGPDTEKIMGQKSGTSTVYKKNSFKFLYIKVLRYTIM